MGKLATVVVEAKQAKYRVRKQRESTANTKKRLNGTDWLHLLFIITKQTYAIGRNGAGYFSPGFLISILKFGSV